MSIKETAIKLKPGIPKRHLLLVASGAWLFAGGFLMFRGLRSMPAGYWSWWRMLVTGIGGLAFFYILFLRISTRHIRRITALEILKPCVFSFFNFRSYLMMALMISLGVTVRKLHLLPSQVISYFFICMAIPLLLSALRFAAAWNRYWKITNAV